MHAITSSRILISGVSDQVGKTLLSIGIIHELRRKGISPSCVVLGPNLLQASIFRRITGRFVRTLDDHLLSANQNLITLDQAGVGADVVLVVGNNGLYDGTKGALHRGSDAEFATLLRTPVVLVADAEHWGVSIQAMMKGFVDCAEGFEIVSSILNCIPSEDLKGNRRKLILEAYKELNLSPPLGLTPKLDGDLSLPDRGPSQAKNTTSMPRQFFVNVAKLVSQHLDIDRLLAYAAGAQSVRAPDFDFEPLSRRTRIAVSDDGCFNLCFQDNMDLLRFFGAEIVSFSPLADEELPSKIGAVYFTGAFLNDYGSELSQNRSMMDSVRDFADSGGVVYAEGSGAAYMCRAFQNSGDGDFIAGLNIIPAIATSTESDIAFNDMATVEDSAMGPAGMLVKALDTGEWRIDEKDHVEKVFKVTRGGQPVASDGYSPGAQIIATPAFLHFASNPLVAKNLVDASEVVHRI